MLHIIECGSYELACQILQSKLMCTLSQHLDVMSACVKGCAAVACSVLHNIHCKQPSGSEDSFITSTYGNFFPPRRCL